MAEKWRGPGLFFVDKSDCTGFKEILEINMEMPLFLVRYLIFVNVSEIY